MANPSISNVNESERLADDVVLLVGGGPVGLLVAVVLAHYGIKSVLLERNLTTTKWPKMDLTNSRSMELLSRLGITDELRQQGVPSTAPYNVFMTTGLHNEQPFARWEFPSVDVLREQFRQKNDGSSPFEPWQRISQELFEKILKAKCDGSDLIDCRFGWKVESVVETEHDVSVTVIQSGNSMVRDIQANYLVACDGASSRVRRDLAIPLEGGPLPGYALLVHFKSRDLAKLFKFGNFWHLFMFGSQGLQGAVICQDDKEVFTTHLMLPLGVESDSIDSHDAVYQVLGGMGSPYRIEIDEVLVRSTYRHSVAVAVSYRSQYGRVFLAGDSAHQNVPTGGYGMNMQAGVGILNSYEQERWAVALVSVQRSRIHHDAHAGVTDFLASDSNPHLLEEASEAGQALRDKLQQHYSKHNNENQDLGIEMDHRHVSCVYPSVDSTDSVKPPWYPTCYTPNTYIGSRAPHLFLESGSSIFDHYGKYWTLFEFGSASAPRLSRTLLDAAEKAKLPLQQVLLLNEENASSIWEKPLVLVRPDGHVAWRGSKTPDPEVAARIIATVGGWRSDYHTQSVEQGVEARHLLASEKSARTQVHDYKLERMGAMQA
ncbi:hypothetical protein OPT61_g1117 [Boeremia exigua]|uniref:Uncharacterized protein n=1 Tax=Boeremia exigua TaxID=749465 RepID=A0ACC2IRJ1_9PLEO|nr:hypothetical protein OPT61_g1117 [Boeremia exigua]